MQVKVCGITTVEDALMAANLGVQYLGYIINYPTSPRYISPAAAAHIIRKIRLAFPEVRHVGVVVNPSSELCRELIDELDIDVVQLHGSETPEYIRQLKYITTWKAIEVTTSEDLKLIPQYQSVVDGIVLDSGKGSGQVIPSELLNTIQITPTFILAGGITPQNIHERITLCAPDVIDLNSGVEYEPGKKDQQKITTCLNIIKSL